MFGVFWQWWITKYFPHRWSVTIKTIYFIFWLCVILCRNFRVHIPLRITSIAQTFFWPDENKCRILLDETRFSLQLCKNKRFDSGAIPCEDWSQTKRLFGLCLAAFFLFLNNSTLPAFIIAFIFLLAGKKSYCGVRKHNIFIPVLQAFDFWWW